MEIDKVRIADFNISIDSGIKVFKSLFSKWLFDFEKADIDIIISKSDLESEKEQLSRDKTVKYDTTYRISTFLRKFAESLAEKNSFLLHGATFDVDGDGVVFCALSGTGKTTHLLNWIKTLDDRITIVNGDKPIVRFFDKDFCKEKGLDFPDGIELGVPYAYGTPWNGKEGLGCNMRTPLKHICFIERSETNFVTKIEKHEAIDRIMKQVYIPNDPEALSKTLELVNRLINSCDVWIIHCNMEPESAKVAYGTIFGR